MVATLSGVPLGFACEISVYRTPSRFHLELLGHHHQCVQVGRGQTHNAQRSFVQFCRRASRRSSLHGSSRIMPKTGLSNTLSSSGSAASKVAQILPSSPMCSRCAPHLGPRSMLLASYHFLQTQLGCLPMRKLVGEEGSRSSSLPASSATRGAEKVVSQQGSWSANLPSRGNETVSGNTTIQVRRIAVVLVRCLFVSFEMDIPVYPT